MKLSMTNGSKRKSFLSILGIAFPVVGCIVSRCMSDIVESPDMFISLIIDIIPFISIVGLLVCLIIAFGFIKGCSIFFCGVMILGAICMIGEAVTQPPKAHPDMPAELKSDSFKCENDFYYGARTASIAYAATRRPKGRIAGGLLGLGTSLVLGHFSDKYRRSAQIYREASKMLEAEQELRSCKSKAEQGDANAQFELAKLYLDPHHPASRKKDAGSHAISLLRLAAAQGHAGANDKLKELGVE